MKKLLTILLASTLLFAGCSMSAPQQDNEPQYELTIITVVGKYEEDGVYYADVIFQDTGVTGYVVINKLDYALLPVGITIPFLIKGV